jgi:hypothetical protein
MDKQQKDAEFVPNLNNYDYIWGSDQDQYVKEETDPEQTANEQEQEELT